MISKIEKEWGVKQMQGQYEQMSQEPRKVPIELFHLFDGQPQCSMIDDVYVSDRHLHKEIEMVYVLRGHVDVKVEERVFQLQEGQLLCIRGSVLHEYLTKSPDTDIAKIKFMKEWLVPPFFQPEQKEAYQQLYSQVFKVSTDENMREIVLGMLDERLQSYNEYRLYGLLVELTATLLSNPSLIDESMPVEMENQRYMEAALTYLQDHCHCKLTLKMLADHLGLTESYCSKYIKRNTGITFVECLNAIRINNALRLLSYTDSNITEIVDRTGFSSVQTFNRVFKAQTGRSPSEYRRQKKRQAITYAKGADPIL